MESQDNGGQACHHAASSSSTRFGPPNAEQCFVGDSHFLLNSSVVDDSFLSNVHATNAPILTCAGCQFQLGHVDRSRGKVNCSANRSSNCWLFAFRPYEYERKLYDSTVPRDSQFRKEGHRLAAHLFVVKVRFSFFGGVCVCVRSIFVLDFAQGNVISLGFYYQNAISSRHLNLLSRRWITIQRFWWVFL